MKVAEYRDRMGAVRQALTSLKSATNQAERETEAKWVANTLADLKAADCPTAKAKDTERAAGLVREAEAALGEQT